MSLKVKAFHAAIPAPKTADKFYVLIPGNAKSVIKVESTSLPYSQYGEEVIWFMGIPFYLPGGKEVPSEWSCVYVEDATCSGMMLLSAWQRRINTNRIAPIDIKVFVTDQWTGEVPINYVLLKYAWLKRIEPINLDWKSPDEPIKYKLTFRYSAIKRNF